MDPDLKFRHQRHDGRNTAIVATITIVGAPLVAALGWSGVLFAACATVGYLLGRLTH